MYYLPYPISVGTATYPASAKPKAHGDLIWVREISTKIPGAKAWKILYWSTMQDNKTVPVSGIVIAPTTGDMGQERPIVTWAHGTTGIARICTPSALPDPAREANFYYLTDSNADFDYGTPALADMIKAGYVVVATDYQGLGTPGIHQYLIGKNEALNMLDAALAAQQMPQTGAGKKVIAIGWSQGGQAAAWAAQIPEYLGSRAKLVGAAALAPVNAYAEMSMVSKLKTQGKEIRPVTSAERLMAWYAMTLAFPGLNLSDVLTPEGIQFFKNTVNTQCAHHMSDAFTYYNQYFSPVVLETPKNQDLWLKYAKENSLANIPIQAPVAVFQGDQDLAVFPAATTEYVKQACRNGATIYYWVYKDIDHIRLSGKAKNDFLPWMQDRFAGKPAPSNCDAVTKM